MSNNIYLFIGTAGSIISVAGNLPMLFHLIKAKDSTGQSLYAWYTWETANVMLLIYAIHINDIVFSLLQVAWVVFCGTIISLVIRYKPKEVAK